MLIAILTLLAASTGPCWQADAVKSLKKVTPSRNGFIGADSKFHACSVPHRRGKRDLASEAARLGDIFRNKDSVEAIARAYDDLGDNVTEPLYRTVIVRPAGSWDLYNDREENPVIQYTFRQSRTPFTGNQEVVMPLVVRARYTSHTKAVNKDHATGFSRPVYNALQPRPGDHRGHLVPHSLGGTMAPYFCVPQAGTLNNGALSQWSHLERIISKHARKFPSGVVEHTVALQYDLIQTNRPISFAVRARFYNDNRDLVDPDTGTVINSFADNDFENMFFANDDINC